MLCNVLTTVGGAALSETQAAQKGAEVFEAWNIINYTEYSYMVNDYVSSNHMFVENLRTEHDWDTLLTACALQHSMTEARFRVSQKKRRTTKHFCLMSCTMKASKALVHLL